MPVAQNVRGQGLIPHWGSKVLSHHEIDGQGDLQTRGDLKAWGGGGLNVCNGVLVV